MSLKKNFLYIKSIKNKKIKHGFFLRTGGVSKSQFKSLNCSFSNGDKKKLVDINRKICLQNLCLNNKKLIIPVQTHSSKVYKIEKINNKKVFADGLITSDKKIALAVLTADCAPIFIFDKNNKFICCLHSGWRGTFKNITKKAVKIFNSEKIDSKDLIAIVGPCLGFKNYEVKENFKKKFISKNIEYKKYFSVKNNNRALFDLRGVINFQLKKTGVKKIYNINRNTYSNKSLFFSYRRSKHEYEKNSGRLINIISFS
tara:strand:- start:2541 stop:3311 length:771 start_codon:yes stop_codon:yes gene_type:complete